MAVGRLRGIFGEIQKVILMTDRATAMADGMAGDTTTYASPPVAITQLRTYVTSVLTAHAAVKTRVVGAVATRQVAMDTLRGAMETERGYLQGLADANVSRAREILVNGGLLIAGTAVHTKLLIELRKGPVSGSIVCDANVKMLIAMAAPKHPHASRSFGWQLTLDGSKTFQGAPTTSDHKTLLSGLPVMTVVGVRVNITIDGITTLWSDVATILVT
jgi:hypothetical protein